MPYRIRQSDILTLTILKRFLHFFSSAVIFKCTAVPARIIENIPVLINLCDARGPVYSVHLLEILCSGYIDRSLDILCLLPDLRFKC